MLSQLDAFLPVSRPLVMPSKTSRWPTVTSTDAWQCMGSPPHIQAAHWGTAPKLTTHSHFATLLNWSVFPTDPQDIPHTGQVISLLIQWTVSPVAHYRWCSLSQALTLIQLPLVYEFDDCWVGKFIHVEGSPLSVTCPLKTWLISQNTKNVQFWMCS